MKKIFFLLIVIIVTALNAQTDNESKSITITGAVFDSETKEPLIGANIFIDGTIYGTTSDLDGNYKLEDIPISYGKLIISMIGYETKIEKINFSKRKKYFKFITKLSPKTYELDSVLVNTTEDEEWQEYFETFKEEFLGNNKFAKKCKILNPYSIQFTYNDDDEVLNAYCDSLLLIENYATGYLQKVQLLEFEFNYTLREGFGSIVFYIYYEKLNGSQENQKEWEENREEIFYRGPRNFFYEITGHEFIRPLNLKVIDQEIFTNKVINPGATLLIKPDTLESFQIPNSDLCYIPVNNKLEIEIYKSPNKSSITAYDFDILFNQNGKLLNGERVIFGGFWGTYRIANLLPENYYPKNSE